MHLTFSCGSERKTDQRHELILRQTKRLLYNVLNTYSVASHVFSFRCVVLLACDR